MINYQKLLPFFEITNSELINLAESIQTSIKNQIADTTFGKHIQANLPNSYIIKKGCKYYDVEEVDKILKISNNESKLNIMHINIRSLDLHFGEMLALLESVNNQFQFIALSEIGQKNIENREAFLKTLGYNMKYIKPTISKGGCALISKDSINLTARTDLNIENKTIGNSKLIVENMWYQYGSIIIGTIYKHPGCSMACIDSFTNQLENIMKTINKENKQCYILGDLNLDGLKVNLNEHVKSFFDTLLDNNFIPTITKPTRIFNNSVSLIDHIIINSKTIQNKQTITTGNIYSGITDHLPIFISTKIKGREKIKRPIVRIYGNKNTMKFTEKLNSTNWEEFYKTESVNKAIYLLYNEWNNAFEKSFPKKRLSIAKSKDKAWITPELKHKIKIKKQLHKKVMLDPSAENKLAFTKMRNKLTNELKKTHGMYYQNKIQNEKQNLKVMWNIFGTIINPQKMKHNSKINELTINKKSIKDGHEISNIISIKDDQEISNTINNFFSTVGSKLAEKHNTDINAHKKYLTDKINNTIYLFPTNQLEISNLIQKLDPKKPGGSDNISPKLIIAAKETMIPLLEHIFNLSFNTKTVPEKLKIAKLIPIFKKLLDEERLIPGNYRPISLLSILNKLLEKLMYARLISFINKNKILYQYQFGFRKKHSTTLALIEITDNILKDLEEGNFTAGIFIDFKKAFDTVDHKILFSKLEHYGIRGPALQWLKSYLTSRQQYSYVNGKESTMQKITYGVPQGSVLGPLLFLIYTNDIGNCTDSKIRLFADDTNSFVNSDSYTGLKKIITSTLKEIFKWCSDNKLTINIDKTCYSIFHKPNQKIPALLNNIKINNNIIKREEKSKYLGILIDETLSFKPHITELITKLTKIVNSFKIVKHYVPIKNRMLLFDAYFISKLQYGIEIYGSANNMLMQKLQVKQNRALKTLFNLDYLTPTKQLHKDYKVLMVKDRYKLNLSKFAYKQQNNLLPTTLENYFTNVKEKHNYQTRTNEDININNIKTEIGKRSIKYQGAHNWNSIPIIIRKSKTLKTFAKSTQKHLISQYSINQL